MIYSRFVCENQGFKIHIAEKRASRRVSQDAPLSCVERKRILIWRHSNRVGNRRNIEKKNEEKANDDVKLNKNHSTKSGAAKVNDHLWLPRKRRIGAAKRDLNAKMKKGMGVNEMQRREKKSSLANAHNEYRIGCWTPTWNKHTLSDWREDKLEFCLNGGKKEGKAVRVGW